METIRDRINAVGVDHIILSSDFGSSGLTPPVEGFENILSDLIKIGVSQEDIRKMICDNPKRLLI